MENFDLQVATIDVATRQVRVAVVHSPAGEAGPLDVTLPEWSLDSQGDRAVSPVAFGHSLRLTAMPDPFWSLWQRSHGLADGLLRTRVRTVDAGAAAVPWELLYDDARAVHLALDPATPVVRYLEGNIATARVVRPAPLHLLLTGASPEDLDPLPIADQHDALVKILRKLDGTRRWQIQREDHLVGQRLVTLLVDQPDIVHFTGHGLWDASAQHGVLLLEDGAGGIQALPAPTLAPLLRSRGVRLVVLIACQGGVSGPGTWAGMAQSLVQAGVPAVVAMAAPIAVPDAAAFGQAFYTALAAGEPLDAAVTAGRQALLIRQGGSGSPTWAIPLLFMRTPDARLWADPPSRFTVETPQEDRGDSISIGSVTATNFFNKPEGPIFIDQRGAGSGPPDASTDESGAKLDALLAGQAAMRADIRVLQQRVLARFDTQEQSLIGAFVSELSTAQLAQVDDIVAALTADTADVSTEEQELWAAVQEVLVEVRRHGELLGDIQPQLNTFAHAAVVDAPALDMRHRLKITAPLVPWFLSYEGEIDLGSRINLEAAWTALVGKVRGGRPTK